MNQLLTYLHQMPLMGWLIIIVLLVLLVISVYSQLRKRRSDEK